MLDDVQKYIDYIIEYVVNLDNNRLDVAIGCKYIADNYKIKAEVEDENRVVLNTLETYPTVDLHKKIDELSEEYKKTVSRDSLRYIKEWAYIYGSKGKDTSNVELPQFRSEPETEVQKFTYQLNQNLSGDSMATVNDISLSLKLANIIFSEYGFNEIDSVIWESDVYHQVTEIVHTIQSSIESKDSLNWDLLGKTFDLYTDLIQQDIMEELGKKKMLRNIKDFDGTTDEFVDQWEHLL